jgi:hypothetical protein
MEAARFFETLVVSPKNDALDRRERPKPISVSPGKESFLF